MGASSMIGFEIEVPDLERLKKSGLNKAKRWALQKSLEDFQKSELPKRFTDGQSIASKLKWAFRSKGWKETKRNLRGPSVAMQPHKLTGRAEKAAQQAFVEVRGSTGRIKIMGLHEGYGRVRNRRINLRDELSRMGAREEQQLAENFKKYFVQYLAEHPEVFKKKKLRST